MTQAPRPQGHQDLFGSSTRWRDPDPASFSVLVADDSAEIRIGLRMALVREGFQVSEASDGQGVIDHLQEHPTDLVLLDVMMPALDGISVLKELRADPTHASTYVIMLTGRSSLEEKVQGLNVGADDYLTKPFELKELLARVRAGIRIKALQRELQESQETIVRQAKRATIGRLAAGIAHEFNNLMSAISGYAQLARNNRKYTDRLIEVTLSQAQRAQKITASLSSFAGNGMAGAQPTPLQTMVDAALCLIEKDLQNREIEVEFALPADLPLVMVEKAQMQQVFLHLLLNAVQAAGDGGHVIVRGEIADDNVVRVEIDDNGPGIPDDLRHCVFDPFFTTKGALGSAEEPGTGLGLAFAMNTVHELDGRLALVPSQLGGACFRVDLPAVRHSDHASDAPDSNAHPCATSAAPINAHTSIVLIEDDPDLTEIVKEVLGEDHLTTFDNGAPAIAHCQQYPVGVVVLDLQLSGSLSGRDVLHELEKLPQMPAVIVTTGSVEILESDLPDTISTLLRKPYGLSDLEDALANALPVAT
ncbi:MAG: response regulator [Planctomycetota bacterium]